jgi:hypothetical protein
MALTTAAVVVAGAGAYSANRQASAGKRMASLGRQQAERQAYYDNQLRELIADPSKIYSDKGYLESQRQGVQAIERAGTLSGFTGSGNAAIALQKFGQSFATDYLRQQQQLLASMAGGNFNPASAMSAGSNADATAFQQLGSTLASLGYAFGGSGGGSGSSGTTTTPGSIWGAPSGPGATTIGGGYVVNTPGYTGGSYDMSTGTEGP